MINQQLADYIKKQLEKGIHAEQIKKTLLANNWRPNNIEEAFDFVVNQLPINKGTGSSEIKNKINIWKSIFIAAVFLIVTFVLTGFFLWRTASSPKSGKNEVNLMSQQSEENNSDAVVPVDEEENPGEVFERIWTGCYLQNDDNFIKERSYCDLSCEKLIKDSLGMTFQEYLGWSSKITGLNRKIKINKIETKLTSKTSTEAVVDFSINYSDIDNKGKIRGSSTTSGSQRLIKVGNKWMTDEEEVLSYSIPLTRNYQKLFNDLEKCKQKQKIEITVPKSGGTFSIEDKENPLNGFFIRFPKLKEEMKISIGCSEFPPIPMGEFYISLPVSIKADKDFSKLVDVGDLPLVSPLSVSKIEADKVYSGKFPLIKIPYNELTVDENSLNSKEALYSFIDASFEDKSFAESGVIYSELDTRSNLAAGFFSRLYDTWAVTNLSDNFKEYKF